MSQTLFTNSELVGQLGLPESILTELAESQGEEFSAKANEFISTLINKIVYTKVARMSFSNPFGKFEGFPVEFGDTIENIFVELPKGYKFDKDATDPFTKKTPAAKVWYATINYEMQYCVTIQDDLLRRAVKSRYGLMNLVENILAQLGTAKELDEYQAQIRVLNNADLYAGEAFETLDVSEEATDAAKYKKIGFDIVSKVNDFCLPSDENNAGGVMEVSSRDDVLLIIKQSLLDHINWDYLAGVYNLSKTELVKHIITVRGFQVVQDPVAPSTEPTVVGEDIDYIVMDTRCFDNHTCLQDGSAIYNPKGRYTNHYTNLWKIMSFKKFHNAKAVKIQYTAAAANAGESQGE